MIVMMMTIMDTTREETVSIFLNRNIDAFMKEVTGMIEEEVVAEVVAEVMI
jgi:hypothetical protein